MTRARFASAVTAAALSVALVGCTADGRDPAPAGPDPAPTGSSASPSVTEPLQVAVYGGKVRLEAYSEIVDAFMRENPGIDVELTSHPDPETAIEASLSALESGSDPDVLLADYRQLPRLLAADAVAPVDALLEERGLQFGDDYQRVALTSFSAENRLQCMPAEMSPLVVYYNRQLVRRADPGAAGVVMPTMEDSSWSWPEFVTLARAIAGLDQLGPIKGAHIPADIETLTAFVRSAGGDVVDDVFLPTTLDLTSDEALETVRELTSFSREGTATPTVEELAEHDAVDLFVEGRLGMVIGTRDDLPQLRAERGLRFDVAPLPSFGSPRSVSYMNGWCINAASDQVDVATRFVTFAVGEEGAEIAAESGAIVPSNLDIVHDESFTQPGSQPRNSHFYASAIRRSDPMPFSDNWNAVADEVEDVLARLYTRPRIDLDEGVERRMTRLTEFSQTLLDGDLE